MVIVILIWLLLLMLCLCDVIDILPGYAISTSILKRSVIVFHQYKLWKLFICRDQRDYLS